MEVTVVPNTMSVEDIIAKIDSKEIDGVFYPMVLVIR